MNPRLRLIPVALLLAGGSYGLWRWLQPQKPHPLTASGTLEATEINLASRLAGRILEIPVQEGQQVKKGQSLLRLDTAELQAQLRQALAQQRAAQAQFNLVRAGALREDIDAAGAALRAAELRVSELSSGSRPAERQRAEAEVEARVSQLGFANHELARLQALAAEQAVTPQAVDQARNAVDQARSALKASEQSRQLVLEGSRSEEIGIARQQARQQQAQLSKLRHGARAEEIQVALAQRDQVAAQAEQLAIRLADGELYAPCACRISVIGAEPGELAAAGSPLITLLDPGDLWVRVYLSPLELSRVRMNQEVGIRADAWPDQTFAGRVVYISPVAEFTPRNVQTREERIHQVYAVKVALSEPEPRLFAGTPVDVIWPEGPAPTKQVQASPAAQPKQAAAPSRPLASPPVTGPGGLRGL